MKSNEMAIYEYNGNPISFDKIEKGYMINATQMAKPFGKNVRQWFDNHATHEYIEAVAADKGIEPMGKFRTSLNASDLAKRYPMLVKVSKGGMPGQVVQGTWMHEDVALEFARWLSPKFAIWCNNRIKELLLTGSTVIDRYDKNKREFPRAFSRNGLGRLLLLRRFTGSTWYHFEFRTKCLSSKIRRSKFYPYGRAGRSYLF